MPQIVITIKGLNSLKRALVQSPMEVKKELSNAVRTATNFIRPIMVTEAPIKTGLLRRNIYARASGLTGAVGPNLEITPYAYFVHEGTRRIKRKNPFVIRTAQKVEKPVEIIFQNAVNNVVRKIAKY